MPRQVAYSAHWYNTPPLGPAIDFITSGGFHHNQVGAGGWLALCGLGGLIGLAIHLFASIGLRASMAGGLGLAWIAAITADRLHGQRLRAKSRGR
jgi:hypothetical protein